ncbi:MAG: nucleotide sugar dehydrogenase [Saprospiraceae bacterium]|jgi:UDP-N-acetyl-D-glucosamine/UDP-N-acetyl-D-galactosamine dehydrogenase|nr:nucleotide sugar dehydrogenase [Saprospiraceae bacterium]
MIAAALTRKERIISVTGLGYTGLPLALAFARKFRVIGFDTNAERIRQMQQAIDPSHQLEPHDFANADIVFSADAEDLKQAHFHIVTVPTPVDALKNPDLSHLLEASAAVGAALKSGDYVVYESTVYPGCTEEDCLPVLERYSGLQVNRDFKLGYSPERINPGDRVRTLETIVKVVSGSDETALEDIAAVYEAVVSAGVHRAASIKVAEAAKVIENTQRDLNISLMNELSIIFDKMGIDTRAVLEAAGTKWNFLPFFPGLVGGHCISVDPYYLLHQSRKYGYEPQVILSGRRVNDAMPAHIAKRLVQLLIARGKNPSQCKVLVMGVTFKENVADIRNSKVAELVRELMQYSVAVHLVDPLASANEVAHEYKLSLLDAPGSQYDAVCVAVAHEAYRQWTLTDFKNIMTDSPVLFDLKGIFAPPNPSEGILYWRL